MNKIKKTLAAAAILVGTCAAPVAALQSFGQELTDADGNAVSSNAAATTQKSGGGFYEIVFGSGVVGMFLWFGLFVDAGLAIYFSIDSSILIKPSSMCWNAAITMDDMADGFCWQTSIAFTTSPSAIADWTPSRRRRGISLSGLMRMKQSIAK